MISVHGEIYRGHGWELMPVPAGTVGVPFHASIRIQLVPALFESIPPLENRRLSSLNKILSITADFADFHRRHDSHRRRKCKIYVYETGILFDAWRFFYERSKFKRWNNLKNSVIIEKCIRHMICAKLQRWNILLFIEKDSSLLIQRSVLYRQNAWFIIREIFSRTYSCAEIKMERRWPARKQPHSRYARNLSALSTTKYEES